MEALSPLTLIVKAPNLRAEDKRVACDRSWTVRQLKEHLSTVYPDKPHKDEQKLVYFGKLLKDESCLDEVLTQDSYDDAHTVHLVCPSQFCSVPDKPSPYIPRFLSSDHQQPGQAEELRRRLPSAVTDNPEQSVHHQHPQDVNTNIDQQSQYWNSYWAQMSTAQTNQTYLTPPQRLWLQLYQQQQWNLFNLQRNQLMYTSQTNSMASPNPLAQQVPDNANQPAAAAAAAAQPPAGDDVVRLNAQGGVDADGAQRDWLDTMYAVVRFGMMLMLLYFYTTFGRFSIVLFTGLFFYLAQANFFRLQRRRPAPAQPQPPQNEQNQAENQNNENNEIDNGRSTAGQTENNNNIPVGDQTSWFDSVKVIFTFAMTFFTSLIPQNPGN